MILIRYNIIAISVKRLFVGKKDSVKEDIATYRAGIMLLLTSIFGVFGYAIINLNELALSQMLLGICVCFILLIGLVVVVKKYLQSIKILEEME